MSDHEPWVCPDTTAELLACPTCSTELEVSVVWTEDADGDGPYTRVWYTPDLAAPAICPTCGTEPDADTLAAWLEMIAEAGWPADFHDREPSMTLPY